jgi:hypothetical protein
MSKKYTVIQLKKICKEKGIKGYSKMKKAELMKHCLDKKSVSPRKSPLQKQKKSPRPLFLDNSSITGFEDYIQEKSTSSKIKKKSMAPLPINIDTDPLTPPEKKKKKIRKDIPTHIIKKLDKLVSKIQIHQKKIFELNRLNPSDEIIDMSAFIKRNKEIEKKRKVILKLKEIIEKNEYNIPKKYIKFI